MSSSGLPIIYQMWPHDSPQEAAEMVLVQVLLCIESRKGDILDSARSEASPEMVPQVKKDAKVNEE